MTSGEKLALYLRVVKDLTGIGGVGMNEVVSSGAFFSFISELFGARPSVKFPVFNVQFHVFFPHAIWVSCDPSHVR